MRVVLFVGDVVQGPQGDAVHVVHDDVLQVPVHPVVQDGVVGGRAQDRCVLEGLLRPQLQGGCGLDAPQLHVGLG